MVLCPLYKLGVRVLSQNQLKNESLCAVRCTLVTKNIESAKIQYLKQVN